MEDGRREGGRKGEVGEVGGGSEGGKCAKTLDRREQGRGRKCKSELMDLRGVYYFIRVYREYIFPDYTGLRQVFGWYSFEDEPWPWMKDLQG